MKIGPEWRIRAAVADSPPSAPSTESGGKGVVALILVGLVLVAAFIVVVPNLPTIAGNAARYLSQLMSALLNLPGGDLNSSLNFVVYSPLILNGSAAVSFPPLYGELSSYALGLINRDRANSSLGAVTISPVQAGQQHADSMLRFGYFSHYDTQGYKPYMRYTLLGGDGAVFENIAFTSYSGGHYYTVHSIEADLQFLEYSMMYRDLVCCHNGHRDNILNPLHNRVSIGIAYNSTTLFFAEDFESRHVNMTVSVSKAYVVTMSGDLSNPSISSSQAFVTYDPPPAAADPAHLNALPREYDPGTFIGGVLPKSACAAYPFGCSSFQTGYTAYASTWTFGQSGVNVTFSLSQFISRHGSGVYTIYLAAGGDTSAAITSYSVFVS